MSARRTGRFRLAGRVASLCLALACGGEPSEPPRGVVLISIDTLRPDHLGAYGYDRPTSPTLDRLAAEGVLFEVASSVSPWTLPAHATLLTGRYPHHHGVLTDEQRLPAHAQTLAARLRRAGFDTAGFVNHLYVGPRHGLDQGFDVFELVAAPQREPSQVADRGLAWLAARSDDPARFLLFLHFYDVHSDYRSLASYEALFASPYDGPIDGSTDQLLEVLDGQRRLDAADRSRLIDLYDAGVRQVDAEVERIVAWLAERGLLEQVLVVVSSDHGEEFLEHGGVLHARTHYEELLRIPLILRGPGLPRGARVRALASIADVTPTLLSLLGIPGGPFDGVDLSPLWRGAAAAEPPDDRFVLAHGDHSNARKNIKRSLRGPRYKLIYDRLLDLSELYDLAADPGEQRDLAALQPERRKALEHRLEQLLAAGGPEAPEAPALSREDAEQLRALGYGAP